jgi:hypothetical protein
LIRWRTSSEKPLSLRPAVPVATGSEAHHKAARCAKHGSQPSTPAGYDQIPFLSLFCSDK